MPSTASKQQQPQQQTLTEFFAAKKSSKVTATKQASQALEKLRSLHADLEEMRAMKANLRQDSPEHKTPSYERYANLLIPKLSQLPESPSKEVVQHSSKASSSSSTVPKATMSGKNALSRLETKRAALKAARDKLRQIETDKTALETFRETKKATHEVPEVPAYEKYHYLTVPSDTLPLPAHYQKLFEGFCASDTVVSMFQNRKEICRMEKLSLAVRKMTRHNFGLAEVAKILTLEPNAYRVSVEQHRFLDSNQKMHHIIDFAQALEGPKLLAQRKSDFKEKLILRVAQYHQEFIDRVMPGSTIPTDALKRWHPKFRLDEVPEIIGVELPKLPSYSSETPKAKDILEKVRGRFSTRIEKALESLAEKQEQNEYQANKACPNNSDVEKSVQGVSKDLLERIRQKEALKMAEKMVMAGGDAKERRQLIALPNLIRKIRQIFLSSQKAAILYADLTAKLNDCGSYDDLDSLMDRLSEVAPEWYKPLKVRNAQYVKIDKERDINNICDRVENLIKDSGSLKGL